MKSLRNFLIAATVAGCGGGSPALITNFTGATWSVNETVTLDCAGQSTSDSESETVAFTQTSAGVGYVSGAGCDFQFSVSGDTATLANGPVTCSTVLNDGSTLLLNVDSYTATCSDGLHLTIVASGTVTDSGSTCTLTIDGSGTR